MQSGQMPGNLGANQLGSIPGLGNILSYLFNDASAPYDAAMQPYSQYMNKATNALNPFAQAGQGAVGNYQQWLQGMQDPSKFMNNLMGQYQESPWAKYQQQQATRAAQNLGSANGLTGSTPLQMQAQQNASNISSQDMQNWLSNALGINQQYGAGQANLMGMGAGSANALANLFQNQGQGMGNLAFGQQAGENQNMSNLIGGFAQLAPLFLGMM